MGGVATISAILLVFCGYWRVMSDYGGRYHQTSNLRVGSSNLSERASKISGFLIEQFPEKWPGKRLGNTAMNGKTTHEEAGWRAEFERLGELLVYDNVKQGAIYNNEAKRQAALRWLGEMSRDRRVREKRTLQVAWWTFFAAGAAVIIAMIGIAVTLLTEWSGQ